MIIIIMMIEHCSRYSYHDQLYGVASRELERTFESSLDWKRAISDRVAVKSPTRTQWVVPYSDATDSHGSFSQGNASDLDGRLPGHT